MLAGWVMFFGGDGVWFGGGSQGGGSKGGRWRWRGEARVRGGDDDDEVRVVSDDGLPCAGLLTHLAVALWRAWSMHTRTKTHTR